MQEIAVIGEPEGGGKAVIVCSSWDDVSRAVEELFSRGLETLTLKRVVVEAAPEANVYRVDLSAAERRVLAMSLGRNPDSAIPKDVRYPSDAVQCDACGGWGCEECAQRGWHPAGHPKGRYCQRSGCGKPIPPSHLAVYCSNECAFADA